MATEAEALARHLKRIERTLDGLRDELADAMEKLDAMKAAKAAKGAEKAEVEEGEKGDDDNPF